MAQVTLTHSSVNSGTAVELYNTEITFGFKKLINTDPVSGKYDIVEANYDGFENPLIALQCVIDVDDIPTNGLTQQLLTEFATLRSTTPITLSITSGSSGTALGGRPSGGYTTTGSMALSNTINVIIESFDIRIASSSEMGHLWNVSIKCRETT